MTTSPLSSTTTTDAATTDPALEANLRALTTYKGEPTALWQSALDQHGSTRHAPHSRLKLAITLASAAAIIIVAAVTFTPMMQQARTSVGRIAFDSEGGDSMRAGMKLRFPSAEESTSAYERAAFDGHEVDRTSGLVASASVPALKSDFRPRDNDGRTEKQAAQDSPRSVIRKATLELAVPDARETFAKCQHLLRLDLGEFVEGSTLSGQGNDARAQLTLRVAASRMDEVLNSLRALGKIDSENATGDDVSAQVVDLDARLRNERQVETEVLKLLESRKDAQLKDILELREKLSSIRSSIEQLQGRRDTLGRQISLASILVLIRPDTSEKPVVKPSSLFDGFSNEMSNAWTSGLNALTQTMAFLIRIAVGGLIWWLLLFAAIAIARRAIRRWIPDPAAVPTAI